MGKPLRVINSYEILYLTNNFKQNKSLVTKEDWDNIILPTNKMISVLESENKDKETEESKNLKQMLNKFFGNYKCFPIGSPLHKSIQTGKLELPIEQGGIHFVTWNKI